MRKRQEAGRSSLFAAVMPSKGDGAGTDSFRQHRAYGQLRNTENRQRLQGLATASLMPHRRLVAVPPCSYSLLPDKDFYDRPATFRLFQQSTGRDSDNSPLCCRLITDSPCRDWSVLIPMNVYRIFLCPWPLAEADYLITNLSALLPIRLIKIPVVIGLPIFTP